MDLLLLQGRARLFLQALSISHTCVCVCVCTSRVTSYTNDATNTASRRLRKGGAARRGECHGSFVRRGLRERSRGCFVSVFFAPSHGDGGVLSPRARKEAAKIGGRHTKGEGRGEGEKGEENARGRE